MSPSVPDHTRSRLQQRLQTISELASYLGHADSVMREDPAEWHRNLIRALHDLGQEAFEAEHELTVNAMQTRALGVTEVAKAARLSKAAVYLRVKTAERQEE